YRLWTLKEAYGKRTGQGVAGDLKAETFHFSGNDDPYEIVCTDEDVSVRQYRITDEHILSVCTEQGSIIKQKAPEPFRVGTTRGAIN
ncbi:MAG: 4'-phosphopantetheinyl transferase superfamily protein, partial [Victivallales bacterium]|nr:4'-phosphopantetheinyl transferase superfamily protein [Victivallales bacterium]